MSQQDSSVVDVHAPASPTGCVAHLLRCDGTTCWHGVSHATNEAKSTSEQQLSHGTDFRATTPMQTGRRNVALFLSPHCHRKQRHIFFQILGELAAAKSQTVNLKS